MNGDSESATLQSEETPRRSCDAPDNTQVALHGASEDPEKGNSSILERSGDWQKRSKADAVAELEREENAAVVDFEGPEDIGNPMNWAPQRKWGITAILAGMTFTTTFTSAIFSTSVDLTAKEFKSSTEVMALGTSLFLLGFTFGPILWGPISELYGRRPPLIIGTLVMALFQVGVSVARNNYTILICRFFAGVFGCAPLAVVGGALSDFWDPVQRGVTVGLYSMCTFVGPVAAPIAGGYIAESYLGWRWTEYLSVIMAVCFWAVAFLFLPETYHPRILQLRAKKLRLETGNWAIHAAADEKVIDARIILEKYLTRPVRMLALEPILLFLALYIGLAYGILYLFFTAYPISFQHQRQWSQGKASLPFLSISIGVISASTLNTFHTLHSYRARLAAGTATPESRLPPMILGSLLLPPGLFLWAWTSPPHITPWPQIFAGVPMGMGILLIMVNGLNYIVDVYKVNANSAIAANTMVRSLMSAGLSVAAERMYASLGVRWATSLLGFVAVGLGVGPMLFWTFGAKVRGWSRFVEES
ncbi:MAG: hypothetical protein Q9195_006549 [Heterodermia aff. obscurata]